jgi:Na+/H+ antiporter NhaD/arsenite permease-like protein
VLGLLEAISMAKAIAAQTGQKLDINQQCLSEGLANVAGSFFQCFPGSGSLTRSAINQHAGAKTQWSSFFSAAAVAATLLVIVVRWRVSLQAAADVTGREAAPRVSWLAAIVVVVTALLVVTTSSPAIAVAAVGLGAVGVALRRGRLNARAIYDAVDPLVLMGLFGIAVGLGTLARTWDGPSRLLGSANRPTTMVVAALATVVINNLPAAALFGARSIPHPRALLLGLNLGPNLAVTGSLSAFVWIKAARSVGARPDWRTVTAIGVVLVPLSLAAAGLATHLLAPSGW